jgi:acyl transferase domain-containing protein
LSAKTIEQLWQKAVDLLGFIRAAENRPMRRPKAIDLTGMGYTLQTGREAMEERLGFIVGSVDQLAEKLQFYIDGEQGIEGVYQGRAKRNNNKDALSLLMAEADLQGAINKWVRNKELAKLLDLWVNGVELDWDKFYGDAKPRRVRLPVYPFAKERYWTDDIALTKGSNDIAPSIESFGSFEDVIDKIDKGLMDENEGVKVLRMMV